MRSTPLSARPALALAFVAACAPDSLTESTLPPENVSYARPADASAYVAQEVGWPAGDVSSTAMSVNDSGYVAGFSEAPSTGSWLPPHAFLKIGTDFTVVSTTGRALAISNTYPLYIVGSNASTGTDRPARWTIATPGAAASEEILTSAFGSATDVNDLGVAVGSLPPLSSVSQRATVWALDGSAETIVPAAPYERTTGRGINNAGHLSVTFHDEEGHDRGFLRVDGTMIELPPAAPYGSSYSLDVSNPVGGIVYVAGVSADGVTNTDYHLTRWTVDVVSKQVIATDMKPEISEGAGVSSAGALGGQVEKKATTTGFLWTLAGTLPLKPTRSGNSPYITDVSPNGRYVVGNASYKLQFRAVLWVGPE